MTHLAPTGNLEELDCRESDGIAVAFPIRCAASFQNRSSF